MDFALGVEWTVVWPAERTQASAPRSRSFFCIAMGIL